VANSHGRRTERRLVERIQAQLELSAFRSLPTPVKWYEQNLFVGGLCTFVSVIATVVAGMRHDVQWLLFCALPFGILATWVVADIVLIKKLWKAIAAIIVPGVVVVILYVWLNPSSEKAPDFALSMSPFIFHNSPNGMWFGTSSETTRTISPVGLLVGIRILNTQNVPAFVERYSFYAWENGQWNLLNRIDTRFGGLFLVMNGDFAHASPQHSGQFIDREIGKKQIGPREARHG
jgi:hypothetical protein